MVGACVLVAGGCGDSPVAATAPDRCPRTGVVPADLRDVERSGEGLVATTFGEYPDRQAEWARATGVLSILNEVWLRTKDACPEMPPAPAKTIDDAISELETALPAKDQKAAATAANLVGLAVPELFAWFDPEIPIEVVRMDATFRQVGLDAHFADWQGVEADVASLDKDWNASKAAVAERAPTCHRVGGTSTIVGDIDQSVKNLTASSAAGDGVAIEGESENGALEIDTLELLFDCPPDGAPPATGLGSKCAADGDCESGQVCDTGNKGGTCAPAASSANVGSACKTTIDCGSDPRAACNTEVGDQYPGGYCIMEPCDDVQVCPPGATCVSTPHETPGCLKACAADADCRTDEGYVCQLFPTTPPAGFGPSELGCAFPCKDDAGCTEPLTCNLATGKCTP